MGWGCWDLGGRREEDGCIGRFEWEVWGGGRSCGGEEREGGGSCGDGIVREEVSRGVILINREELEKRGLRGQGDCDGNRLLEWHEMVQF